MVWNVLWSWLALERDLGFIVLPKLVGARKKEEGKAARRPFQSQRLTAFPQADENMRFSNSQMLIKMWEAVSVRGTPLQIGFEASCTISGDTIADKLQQSKTLETLAFAPRVNFLAETGRCEKLLLELFTLAYLNLWRLFCICWDIGEYWGGPVRGVRSSRLGKPLRETEALAESSFPSQLLRSSSSLLLLPASPSSLPPPLTYHPPYRPFWAPKSGC